MRPPRDVIPHLARGEAHWRPGYSAHAAATSWFDANDLPPPVRTVLETNPKFAGTQLIDAFLERSTDLGDGYRPSQTDILVLLGLPDEIAFMGVEAKVWIGLQI